MTGWRWWLSTSQNHFDESHMIL